MCWQLPSSIKKLTETAHYKKWHLYTRCKSNVDQYHFLLTWGNMNTNIKTFDELYIYIFIMWLLRHFLSTCTGAMVLALSELGLSLSLVYNQAQLFFTPALRNFPSHTTDGPWCSALLCSLTDWPSHRSGCIPTSRLLQVTFSSPIFSEWTKLNKYQISQKVHFMFHHWGVIFEKATVLMLKDSSYFCTRCLLETTCWPIYPFHYFHYHKCF